MGGLTGAGTIYGRIPSQGACAMNKLKVTGLIMVAFGLIASLASLAPSETSSQATSEADMLGTLVTGLLIAIVGAILFTATVYNSFITSCVLCDNTWSNIDVLLKRRHDLIDNLVNIVRGYAQHERGTFEAITQMRSKAASATTVSERARAEDQLQGFVSRFIAVAESYPNLKADANFRDLSNKLADTEDEIASARKVYNQAVAVLNVLCRKFPDALIARLFHFGQRDFFRVEEPERAVPQFTS
jgi:LemA protein